MLPKSLLAAVLFFLPFLGPASADEPLYAGKTIELVVPASSGGSYGIYGQLIADHLARHIDGNPRIIPNYIRGAGGMRAANHVGRTRNSDGTVLFLMHQNTPASQLLHPDVADYDASAMIPIGILSSMNSVMVVRSDLGIGDVMASVGKDLVLGSTGRGSYQFIVPTLLNAHLDAGYNIVTTYGGTGETMLALERGEIGGLLTSLLSLEGSHPDWKDGTGSARIILQIGGEADPSLPDTPLLTSLATNEREADIYRFLSLSNGMARSLVMPAGTPDLNVEAIREAFRRVLDDPAFHEDVARIGAPLNWGDHEKLRAIIEETLATPKDVIDLMRDLMTES